MTGFVVGSILGIVFGVFYFVTLWRQVEARLQRRSEAPGLLVSTVVRSLVAMAVFGAVTAFGLGPLLGMAIGFLVGRTLVLIWTIDSHGGDS